MDSRTAPFRAEGDASMAQQLRRIVRQQDLSEYVGLRRTQIDTLIAQGKFPKPVRLSTRRKAWLVDEIAAWQAQRIAERDAAENNALNQGRDRG